MRGSADRRSSGRHAPGRDRRVSLEGAEALAVHVPVAGRRRQDAVRVDEDGTARHPARLAEVAGSRFSIGEP
jgi:hypothetical protein